jgi:hypothetical protein
MIGAKEVPSSFPHPAESVAKLRLARETPIGYGLLACRFVAFVAATAQTSNADRLSRPTSMPGPNLPQKENRI